jgi:hypothetical protein
MPARKAQTPKQLVMEFNQDKETKTTVRFTEVTEAEYKHTFYVSKNALKELGNPASFTVTVDPS